MVSSTMQLHAEYVLKETKIQRRSSSLAFIAPKNLNHMNHSIVVTVLDNYSFGKGVQSPWQIMHEEMFLR